MKWLSPMDIADTFSVSRAKAYRLLKAYQEDGGQVMRIGSQTRVSEEAFTDYLLRKSNETT